MKNKEKVFLAISDILIFVILTYPILKGGVVGGYDPGFHMARISTLASNISHGHFPNPIGFEYLDKLGYGVGFFYGNFLLYPFAIVNALGLSSYHSYLLFLFVFAALNIFSINFVVNKLFNNAWATIVSAPIYLSSYYFYGVIYMRAAAGELIAFALIPWILLSTFKLVKGHTNYWPMLSISLGLLFVSHILSFLITLGTVLIIFIMNIIPVFKNKKIFISFVKSGLLFLGLTSVFLFSFIQQYTAQKYIDTSKTADGQYGIIVNAMLKKNPIFDTQQFLPVNGTFLVILLLASLIFYLIKAKGFHFSDNLIPQAFIIIVLYSSLLLSTDLLKLAVKIFKPLVLLQVISRVDVIILPLLTFVVANALGQIITHTGKLKIPVTAVFLIVIAVITISFPIKSNLAFVANRKGPITPLSVSMGEYEPEDFMKYMTANNFQVTTKSIAKSEGFKVVHNDHNVVTVKIDNNTKNRTIMLPRLYYKGYQVSLNSNGKEVIVPTEVKNGLVAATLPKSFHSGRISVEYKMTTVAKIGWAISIMTLLLSGYLIFKKRFIQKS